MTYDRLSLALALTTLAVFALGRGTLPLGGPPTHLSGDAALTTAFRRNLGGYLLLSASALLAVATVLSRTELRRWATPALLWTVMVLLAQNSWPGLLRLALAAPVAWLLRELWRPATPDPASS